MTNTLPQTGFVRLPQILAVIPIGKSTWWQWVKDGKAPEPIKLGANTTAWKAEDIYKFIKALAESEVQS
jgi:prophage regulatory protein